MGARRGCGAECSEAAVKWLKPPYLRCPLLKAGTQEIHRCPRLDARRFALTSTSFAVRKTFETCINKRNILQI